MMDAGKQSRLFEHGFPPGGPVVDFDPAPVFGLCYYCGKERMLNFKVDGNHVCALCKEDISPAKKRR